MLLLHVHTTLGGPDANAMLIENLVDAEGEPAPEPFRIGSGLGTDCNQYALRSNCVEEGADEVLWKVCTSQSCPWRLDAGCARRSISSVIA